MAAGVGQVVNSVNRIAGESQENAAVAEGVSAAACGLTANSEGAARTAKEMAAVVSQLRKQVARFQVSPRVPQ